MARSFFGLLGAPGKKARQKPEKTYKKIRNMNHRYNMDIANRDEPNASSASGLCFRSSLYHKSYGGAL